MSSSSPDKNYKLNIYYEEPGAAFAPHTIYLHQEYQGKETEVFHTELANDGANLTSNNIVIFWTSENEAILTLAGEEQQTQKYKVIVGTNPSAALLK